LLKEYLEPWFNENLLPSSLAPNRARTKATQDILRSLLATVFYYIVLPIIFIASLLAFIPGKRFAG